MPRKVALLHTSFVFVQRERMLFDLMQEILPDVEMTNIVDDSLLRQVVAQGHISEDVTRRMCLYVLAADALGVDAIFNTCSSLGPTVDTARRLVTTPIVKIDDAMAEKAAREGHKVAVMATVPSTLQPTIDLIQQKADGAHTQPALEPALCAGAFDLLSQGQVERHDNMVAAKAKEAAQWADTIVLAQCSMARLAPRLADETGIPVLSSPRLGIERLKQVLDSR